MSGEDPIAGDPQAALRLAEEIVRQAEAAGAGEAEALVVAGDSALTRFANSEIHQNVASSEVFVNLRFVQGRRVGVASSGRVDPDGIRAPGGARGGDHRVRGGARGLGGPPGGGGPLNLSRPPGRTGRPTPARSSAPRAPAR